MLNKFNAVVFTFLLLLGNISLHSQTLKILPLGNSLTKGVYCINYTITNCEMLPDSRMVGYRYALYQALLNAGYEFEFVGNEHAGDNYFSIQYSRHAGYPGIKTDQLYEKVTENDGYLLISTAPDIVLLEIGTNDIMAGYSAANYATQLNNILNEIDEYENSTGKPVLVLLSKIIKFKQGALYGGNVATYNTSLVNVYNQRVNNGDKICLLDVGSTLSNLLEPAGDMKDELHPNQGGYDKMAAQWFQAINSVNTAPVISSIPNQQAAEGSTFSVISLDNYVYDAEDPDNMIVWTLASEPENFNVNINASRQAVVTPKNSDWNGSESITFIATDRGKVIEGLKKSAANSVNFTVQPVNDAPVILSQTRTPVIMEESSYTVLLTDLNIQDIDNPQQDLSIQVLSGPNYTFTNNTLTPSVDFCGSLPVSIRVNDLTSSSEVFSFTLSVSPKNDPPVIVSASPVTINEDTPRKMRLIDYQVTDPDNFFPADFTLIIGNGQNYTYSGDTLFPAKDFQGTLEVSVRVKDFLDQSNEIIHEIEVMPVNDTPVFIIPEIEAAYEGVFFEVQLAAYDPDDNDQLSITAPSLPQWLSYNSQTCKISGTPQHQHIGSNLVTLRVNDSHVTVDSTINVEVLLGTGFNSTEIKEAMVYPNPVTDYFIVRLKPGTYSMPVFKLYNVTGDLVFEQSVLSEEMTFFVNDIAIKPGIYIFELLEKQRILDKGKLVFTSIPGNR